MAASHVIDMVQVGRLKRWRARVSVATQQTLLGCALVLTCAAVLAVAAGLLTHNRALADQLLAVGVALTIVAALGMVWLGKLRQRLLLELEQAAYAIGRGDNAAQLPVNYEDAEANSASLSLRRMVDSLRQKIQALEAQNEALQTRVEHRTQELTTLAELSHDLASKSDIDGLLQDTLKALEKSVDYSSASIWGREDDGIALLSYRHPDQAAAELAMASAGATDDLHGLRLSGENVRIYEHIEQQRQPIIVNQTKRSVFSWLWSQLLDDAQTSKLYKVSKSWMAVPLQSQDQVVGIMRVDHQRTGFFDAERERLLTAIGDQAGLAMHHAQLQAEARQFAVLTERTRLARELHDAVSQTLFAANVIVGTLRKTVRSNPQLAQEQLLELERLNKGVLAEMRLLMFELRPDAMERADLGELLRHAGDATSSHTGMPIVIHNDSGSALPSPVKVQLYRIAQGALSNAARHSGATQLTLDFRCMDATRCLLEIADNGRGFDVTQEHPGHFGLENMRSRAREIDADLSIQSQPGEGTAITAIWQQGGGYADESLNESASVTLAP